MAKYRRLDSQKLIATVLALQERVESRFPGSGLGKVVSELRQIAEETITRTIWIQKPNLPLRSVVALLSLGMMAILAGLLTNIHQFRLDDYVNFIQALEATIGSVVFIGAAMLFLMNWETRIKRGRALKALHELRAMAHIVDMHQLTKDPERYAAPGTGPTGSSPAREMTPFELNRYLDYCSDALALISKIAALHVQEFQDPVLLNAVDEVENLTAGLSRKIWQKITIFESMTRAGSWPDTPRG